MPLPTLYTPETLTIFMRATLAETGESLAWNDERFAEPINATLLAYGVQEVAQASNVLKLRLLATVEAWQAVVNATAGDYDAASATDDLKRSQFHKQAKAMVASAKGDFAQWLAEQSATPSQLGSTNVTNEFTF